MCRRDSNMQKSIAVLVACFCSFSAAYTITPSREILHYRYDPPQGPRLQLPPFTPRVASQQQAYQRYQQPTYQRVYPQQRSAASLTMLLPSSSVYARQAETKPRYAQADSLRLPLPLGLVSINVGPLPLDEGTASYSSPLTSYGTPYPQKIVK